MGCIPYQTTADADRSLRGCVILYQGRPINVDRVYGPEGVTSPEHIELRCTPLPLTGAARSTVRFRLDDPAIDLSNLRLGYINTESDTVWCTRIPQRGTFQGLMGGNVECQTAASHDRGMEPVFNWDTIIRSDGVTKLFSDTFPTVAEIVTKFNTDNTFRSAAFSRHFALTKDALRDDHIVNYKGVPIGFGNITRGVSLAPRFKHLREQLVELGVNVA